MAAKTLEYISDPNKFDLRTHVWNAQGHLIRKNTYRSHIIEGTVYYERPVNSGNLWFDNNQPAGRMDLTFNDKGHISKKVLMKDAVHVEFKPELKGADKIAFELEQTRARNEQLVAEITAIKAESAAKQPAQSAVTEPPKDETPLAALAKAPTLTTRGV